MVDLDWKTRRMETPEISVKQQPPAPASATSAYEQYLRIPELSRLWAARDFPDWRPSLSSSRLQGLEITFRFVSIALSDPRPYADRREWTRRLETLAARQLEIIAALCEDEDASEGVLSRDRSSSEVWKIPGSTPMVNRTSEASLLPRLAVWERSEAVASKIHPFTLGLGEPNLDGKPNLEYDLICRPAELHTLKRTPFDGKGLKNHENKPLFNVHQILESWIFTGRQLLQRIGARVSAQEWSAASADCWLLERIWKLLAEAEDLHMLMDPDDFLRLKSQLAISADSGFCFRSASLMEFMKASKDLRRLVPTVLGVEVDPNGGPRVQEAAMRLFRRRGAGEEAKVHLLQGFQAVEAAVKRFFFAYRQLVAAVMGNLEASGNRLVGLPPSCSADALAQVFLEPPYFPSLDAAKTFVGDFWQHELAGGAAGSRTGQ
ncbi:unnamed protein product [Spirodela intermedia]|uniref:Hs1pro-1 C-terminal domain-containing protein n=1 Tax=Spirodela intermedia TaxID=51605 RepID=A0A7I8IC26_SPIIN|nr:unnamed protein product [Spirodela intermedia]CAA6655130.1 unnamed protein product [Spirodela intermedia]